MSAKLSSAFLLVGDSFLIEEKVKDLTAPLNKQSSGEIPRQTFYLSDTPIESVLIEARTLPFLTEHQIFIIRDISKMKKRDFEFIEAYLDKPFEGTTLIFECPSAKKTDEIVKLFEKKATAYFLGKGAEAELQQFIKTKVKQAGKTITREAADELVKDAGDMPLFLDSMLERLVLYAGESPQINESMVETFEEDWTQSDIFKITDAIAQKNANRGLELLRGVIEENEKDLIGLLGILHWQIRRLWLAKMLMEEGEAQQAVLKKCRVSFKQSSFFLNQVRRFSREQLEKALEGIFEIDWKMKTGRTDGAIALESWMAAVTA